MKRPLLGIIGGMGAQATACFYEKLHRRQNITKEQDYLDILLYSIPSTPDRTAYITGQSIENPLKNLIHAATTLESAGATCIAIPCVTSHYFYEDLVNAVNIPILNMLDETARFAAAQVNFIRPNNKIMLLATDGTIKGGAFHSSFKKYNIEVITPQEAEQQKLMTLIYDIKRGVDISANTIDTIIREASKTEAGAVVLGCTELCITAEEIPGTINTLDVLAGASIAMRK